MKKILILLGTTAILSAGVANAATTNCAEMEKKIEAEMKTAKLTAAEKKTAEEAFSKAQGECKANKEADAIKGFEEIQKMLKKS